MVLTKNQQAELLFEEFFNVCKRKENAKRSTQDAILVNRGGLEGDDVVADSRKRFSGSFSRETRSLQSRAPINDNEQSEQGFVAQGSVNLERHAVESIAIASAEVADSEHPVEQRIHEVAVNIASMADEINDAYGQKLQAAEARLLDDLNKEGSNASYGVVCAIVSNVVPQDRDLDTFIFAMNLFRHVVSKGASPFFGYLKRFIGEEFPDEAVKCIEENCKAEV